MSRRARRQDAKFARQEETLRRHSRPINYETPMANGLPMARTLDFAAHFTRKRR